LEAIDRTFSILESFLENNEELSISELAKSTGLSPSVIHRIVTSLAKKGYLTQKDKRGKYSLGLKFLSFSYFIQKNTAISNVALPFMLELSKLTNESVTLGIPDNRELVVVERVEVDHDLRVGGGVGKRASLYNTAVGKLFLSQMSYAEKQSIFSDPSTVKSTQYSIVDLSQMEKELERFKIEGCTFDREEMAIGIWSVAAPIYGIKGNIEAGVAVIVPTVRINNEKEVSLSSLIKACAAKISRKLGFRGF